MYFKQIQNARFNALLPALLLIYVTRVINGWYTQPPVHPRCDCRATFSFFYDSFRLMK
jgi:hypothetical protein